MHDFYVLMALKELSRTSLFLNDSLTFLKNNNLMLSEKMASADGIKIINDVLCKSELSKERNIDNLVKELQALWPSGNKDGKYRWKSNEKDVKSRLLKFFKIYGDKYTDEQILEVARNYVKPFDKAFEENGDERIARKYQKVLAYFIYKDKDEISLLANTLEAAENGESIEQNSVVHTSETLFN